MNFLWISGIAVLPCNRMDAINKKSIRVTVMLAIVFFVAGRLAFSKLFVLFEPNINGIHFEIAERPGILPTSWLFALMMLVVVIMVALNWRLGNVVAVGRRTGAVAVILVCMILGIGLRHYEVKYYFISVVRPFLEAKGQLPFNYPIDPANFVYYMFGGCCIGCLLAFLLFRQKNTTNDTKG